jgi:hypothetical protein
VMHRVVSDYTNVDSTNTNVKVFVRARPPDENAQAIETFLTRSGDSRKISIKDPDPSNKHSEVTFKFDRIFWTDTTQDDIFESVAKPQIDHVLQGFNACCFAYGQTGSGNLI